MDFGGYELNMKERFTFDFINIVARFRSFLDPTYNSTPQDIKNYFILARDTTTYSERYAGYPDLIAASCPIKVEQLNNYATQLRISGINENLEGIESALNSIKSFRDGEEKLIGQNFTSFP